MRTADLRLTGHMGHGLSAFDTRWSAVCLCFRGLERERESGSVMSDSL